MCGRYTLTADTAGIEARFACGPSGLTWQPRYNLAPTQKSLVVVRADKHNILKEMSWGLVPHWAREPSIGSRLINARRETLEQKPAFRQALQERRCLIPADGFYEWQKRQRGKVPYRITANPEKLFAFAGLWEWWAGPQGGYMESFTIITTEAIEDLKSIHPRMPLILPPDLEDKWLQGPPEKGAHSMKEFLALMHPELRIRAYRVPSLVNSPANDLPQCLEELLDE